MISKSIVPKDNNYHKILTITFLFVILSLGAFYYLSKYSPSYDFGKFKIEKQKLDEISSSLPYDDYQLCSLKDKECIIITPLKTND